MSKKPRKPQAPKTPRQQKSDWPDGKSRKVKFSKTKEALILRAGLISQTARAIGIGRETLHDWINDVPELQAVKVAAREQVLDVCEGKIYEAVHDGDLQTCRWFAGVMGGSRGYGNKVEVSGAKGGEPIKITAGMTVEEAQEHWFKARDRQTT